MKYNAVIASLLLFILPTMAVNAEPEAPTPSEPQGNGFYLGAKGGWVKYLHACESAQNCTTHDLSWGAFGGYQINKKWALELGYDDLGDISGKLKNSGQHTASANAWEVSAKRNFQLTQKLDFFAKAGAIRWEVKNKSAFNTISGSDSTAILGAGLEFHLSPSWVARAEYQYFDAVGTHKTGGSSINFATLGISYLFGQGKVAPAKPAPKTQGVVKTEPIVQEEPKVVTGTQAAPVKEKRIKINYSFRSGSAKLLSTKGLDAVANKLIATPKDSIVVYGYTDSRGSKASNLKLSKARANTVAKEIIRLGAKKEQITTKGLGETNFVKDNRTRAHRAANRRVEILFNSGKE